MGRFHSAREGKEFLISRIVEETNRENVPLSEVERKMLYFSESDWTLPDIMEVNDQFDRECDQDEYEEKITALVSKAAQHDRKQSGEKYDAWWDAIRLLEKQDHYILVMIRAAGLRPRFDQLKLFIVGLAIAAALVAAGFLNVFVLKR
jgi:ATP-dependent helicase/DNAse subunit B